MHQPLLTNFQLGQYPLRNRVVMAPMTRTRASADGTPSKIMEEYYRQRASAGLIITECTAVSLQGHGIVNAPGLYAKKHVLEWRGVTDAVHREGGRIFAQLWHGGRTGHSSLRDVGLPVAPSAVAAPGTVWTPTGELAFEQPQELDAQGISAIVDDFRKAAVAAREAGFDGVELHGAYGYLIDEFTQDSSNQRTDRYGGTVPNRCRFALEVAEAVASVWGPEQVGFRISPSARVNGMLDSDPVTTFSHLVRELNAMRLGYLHVMEPSQDDLETGTVKIEHTTRMFRPLFDQAVITNVGYDRESGNLAVSEGTADLVAFGTLFISNPDLPARFRESSALSPADPETFYGSGPGGYTDYQ